MIVAMLSRTAEGTFAVSGYTLGLVIFSFAFFPGGAVATAAASLVGINLGNSNPERAYESGWKCAALGAGLISILAVYVYISAPTLMAFFIKDAKVIAIGASLVRTLAVAEPLHVVGYVISRSMQGAGESRIPFLIITFAWLIVRVPLAWFLAFVLAMNSQGVWLAVAFTQVLAAGLLMWNFQRRIVLRTTKWAGTL
jgi:Na+-driven multidrug efflux pump